jgi:hypothetical protein
MMILTYHNHASEQELENSAVIVLPDWNCSSWRVVLAENAHSQAGPG